MNILSNWNSITQFSYIKLKPFVVILSLFISCSDLCYGQEGLKTIAVLEFQNNSIVKKTEIYGLKQGLPSLFISAFSGIKDLQIIDRRILNNLLDKQALIQAGLFEKDSLQKVGKLTGSDYLILGSFLVDLTNHIRIDCRIVNSESGEMIKAEEVTGKTNDFFELAHELIQKLIEDLDIKFSKEEDNELQQSLQGCSFQNMLSYSLALTEIDLGNKKNAKEILLSLISDCSEFSIAIQLLEEIEFAEKK